MFHGPAAELKEDLSIAYKSRIGLVLFFIYFLLYTVFVLMNVLTPDIMQKEILFGVNLAIIYGFIIILSAIFSGFAFHVVCTRAEERMNLVEPVEGGQK
jgi:uncharacterized membrane protein (DUF485 family)